VKLYRALQSQGFGSRKGCVARVRASAVEVNGVVCDDPETDVDPAGLELTLDGVVWTFREKAYVAMHKPAGYECSHHPSHHPSVFSLLPPPLLQRGCSAWDGSTRTPPACCCFPTTASSSIA